ncbi:oxygen-dependent protoporphyrinogen oxidase [Silvibacterium bohemicum]|uniref:Coproporphyrinogen III oxidase n=1 Tax=Silvibacterium bohemicum TaxID=1577686 RepID=A0A841JT92_9BACT|nr:protoporphyrinogen oxidase [Silvibacterium bohemicum]MBB6144623.1 oxygen-dependent protoporphyrinogen oxidase [Silvibacterium bohemicum]
MKRIAIIGGGLSGTAAAWQLARDGQSEFVLYEASSRLGGIVETARVETEDGRFIIECGPDAWVTEKPWARELAIELGLESEIIASNDAMRRTYILRDGRLIPIPDGMRMMVPTQWASIEESPLFSEEARLAYRNEFQNAESLRQSALKEDVDESVASFVRRHFGEEVTHTLAGPLLAGIFGGDVERLSVRAVMPAFVKMEREHGSLIAALQRKQAAQTQSPAVFTTLKGGLQTLVERMQTALPSHAVRLQHSVHAITRRSGQWELEAQGTRENFDAIIVATPPHVTRQLLRALHEDIATFLEMESTSAIVVALAFSKEQSRGLTIPSGFGYLVPPSSTSEDIGNPQLLACTFVDQKYEHRAPKGTVLLRAFFGGSAAKALMGDADGRLIALARQRLAEALVPLPEPAVSLVRRWPLSLPQYAVGHVRRIERLEELVQTMSGLHLVGNAYHGVGLPDMVRQGRDAARKAVQTA